MHKHLQKSTREISTLLGNKQLGGSPCKAYFRSKTVLAKFQRWEDHTRAVEFRIYYLLRSFGQCILSKVKVRMQDIHKKAENVERKISKMFNSKWNYFFFKIQKEHDIKSALNLRSYMISQTHSAILKKEVESKARLNRLNQAFLVKSTEFLYEMPLRLLCSPH